MPSPAYRESPPIDSEVVFPARYGFCFGPHHFSEHRLEPCDARMLIKDVLHVGVSDVPQPNSTDVRDRSRLQVDDGKAPPSPVRVDQAGGVTWRS